MGLLLSTAEVFDFAGELAKQTKPLSVEVQVQPPKDCGPVHRNVRHADELVEYPFGPKDGEEPVDTLWKSFQRGVRLFGKRPMMGTRPHLENGEKFGPYAWTTYEEATAEVAEVAAGLVALGAKSKDRVGICAVNRAEWVNSALAFYSQGMVTVALYDTFGFDALSYIIDHAECEIVLCSVAKLDLITSLKCEKLRHVVVFDADPRYTNTEEVIAPALVERAAQRGVRVIGYSELRRLGRETPRAPNPGTRNDLCFIMYTSGTTGMPKGAMLTNGNIMGAVGALRVSNVGIREEDVHFSFLPLAHIYETALQASLWCYGASMGFYSGHVKRLTADLAELRPTLFAGVPRVFQKIYDKLIETVGQAPFIRRTIFYKCLNAEAYKTRRGEKLDRAAFAQKTVFAGVRSKLGLDRCRIIITGAAPCPPYLMEFLRAVINPEVGVMQGYGLTETAAALTITEPDDHCLGHVGAPVASVEVCLRDVEDMGYTRATHTGEVMARGAPIFKGYYKDPENTEATITPDGWMGTGDIGRWNPNGTLSIIDRKKNIFKLAQGEYIAAEKIEAVYGRTVGVNQICIYGNSFKSVIIAVVVPAWAHWQPVFEQKGWWKGGPDLDAKNPERSDAFRAFFKKVVQEHQKEIAQQLMADMKPVAEAAKLLTFEKVAGVIVEGDIDVLGAGFNVENDTLTPTFKLRRAAVVKRYLEPIKALYTALGEPPKADEKW